MKEMGILLKRKIYVNRKYFGYLAVVLICLFAFSTGKQMAARDKPQETIGGETIKLTEPSNNQKVAKTPEKKIVDQEKMPTLDDSKKETKKKLQSADANVKESYQDSKWHIVKTSQSEPHRISFDAGSLDRIEMKKAFAQSLDVAPDLLEEWWLTNVKGNLVEGFLTNRQTGAAYRVVIEWQPGKGYLPKQVDSLHVLPTHY
ncbi:YrrS family protein [Vagococcus silagei]|uniref:DUF1510 family protein n=1 Tax=Vagococcus silagei TaxID=2508885 RepID=A0A4V3TV36_9ENTE|nr:YrrS family protein [Vagococcus silagei]THB61309.1 DUF1510 family protein [Vagococcus silagei]